MTVALFHRLDCKLSFSCTECASGTAASMAPSLSSMSGRMRSPSTTDHPLKGNEDSKNKDCDAKEGKAEKNVLHPTSPWH